MILSRRSVTGESGHEIAFFRRVVSEIYEIMSSLNWISAHRDASDKCGVVPQESRTSPVHDATLSDGVLSN